MIVTLLRRAATAKPLSRSGPAIDEVLAGKAVSVTETEVDGRLINKTRKPPVQDGRHFAKDVALPILQTRCQPCHREARGAVRAMNFDDAVAHAEMIAK